MASLRVELSSDLGFEILGTLAMAVLCLIALWIIESAGERVKLFVCGARCIGICRSGRERLRPFG